MTVPFVSAVYITYNNRGKNMIGKMKNGISVEIIKIIPDWNQVEAKDGTLYCLFDFEIIIIRNESNTE
jgi:hypothetical protein